MEYFPKLNQRIKETIRPNADPINLLFLNFKNFENIIEKTIIKK
jgi:hypothetical protein